MDIHARIQFELEKIRELEEKQRQQIERERKKQELKRMIQQELDKIKGLDTGKKADDEDMPLWSEFYKQFKKAWLFYIINCKFLIYRMSQLSGGNVS